MMGIPINGEYLDLPLINIDMQRTIMLRDAGRVETCPVISLRANNEFSQKREIVINNPINRELIKKIGFNINGK